jgi:hypothetical protein
VVNETAKSIAVTVPYGTTVTTLTTLVATYTTTGSTVTVGTTVQTSAINANNFNSPVAYTVTAADGTTATYTVTVTVALASSKIISVFTFPASTGTTINEAATPKTIAVTVPYGIGLTNLVATYVSSGSSVTVVATGVQASGTTPNDFSVPPLTYTVHAANGSTATYNVTVTVAAATGAVVCSDGGNGSNCVNLGTAANYAILDQATVTFTPIATITTTPTITGNIGLSPAAASYITGFALAMDPALCFSNSTQVTGNIFAADYSTPHGCLSSPDTATTLTTAVGDENAAYGFAAGKVTAGGGLLSGGVGVACPGSGASGGAMSDVNDGAGGNFPTAGVNKGLPAGVYTCGVSITIPGNLTLHGSATDVWVFQTTGTLSQTGATSVTLTGGALPQNVFWQAAGGVLIGSNAHIEGVILSGTNIQLITGATVTGRLFGTTGVLMDSNTVTQP